MVHMIVLFSNHKRNTKEEGRKKIILYYDDCTSAISRFHMDNRGNKVCKPKRSNG